MKIICTLIVFLILLTGSVLSQDATSKEVLQTQTKPGNIKVLPNDQIEELLKKLDELEKLKRGQRYFRVLAVNDADEQLVLISGGRADGLKIGFRLEVFRKKQTLANIELIEVLEEESIGKVLADKFSRTAAQGDFAKLLPYVPPVKEEKNINPEKSENSELKNAKEDETKKTDDKNETSKFPFEMRELEDLLSETLIEKQKLENENKVFSDELYVLRQDKKALELELQRDEKGARILARRMNLLLQNYHLHNHLGIFVSFDPSYGIPSINGLKAGQEDFFFEYSAGIDFFSAEGVRFSAQYSTLQQPALARNRIAGIFSLELTFYEHFTLGYKDYDLLNASFAQTDSREIVLRIQSVPNFNNIPEFINVLEVDEISLNYGLEIAKDFDAGSGADYRVFAGLNNFFLVQLNFNHSYWTDAGKFGTLYTELRGAIPVFQDFIEVWLMAKFSYQIAFNDKLYKDFGAVKLSCLVYF